MPLWFESFVPLPGLVLAAQIALGGGAWAQGLADCARDAAAQDLAAKVAFQRALRDLVVAGRPAFEGLATVSRDLQVALAEARRARIGYLLDHDPGRIDTTRGVSRFTNFEWSEADSARLAAANDAYRVLEERIAALRAQNDGHPDWPALRAYYRDEVAPSPSFGTLMEQFSQRQGEVAALLERCGAE